MPKEGPRERRQAQGREDGRAHGATWARHSLVHRTQRAEPATDRLVGLQPGMDALGYAEAGALLPGECRGWYLAAWWFCSTPALHGNTGIQLQPPVLLPHLGQGGWGRMDPLAFTSWVEGRSLPMGLLSQAWSASETMLGELLTRAPPHPGCHTHNVPFAPG